MPIARSARHHEAMVALFVAWYCFCRKHETIGTTPAIQPACRSPLDDCGTDDGGGYNDSGHSSVGGDPMETKQDRLRRLIVERVANSRSPHGLGEFDWPFRLLPGG